MRMLKYTPAVHPLWFLSPSLLMSFFCLMFWWRFPGDWAMALPIWLLLLAIPCIPLVFSVEFLRKAGVLSDHPVVLVLGNLSSVAALRGLLALSKANPGWEIYADPTSPYDTLRGIALVLAVGCAAFVLPGLVLGIAKRTIRSGEKART